MTFMLERWATVTSPLLDEGMWELVDLEGEEELNRLYRFELHLVCRDRGGAVPGEAELLDAALTLRFHEQGRTVGIVHGIVSELRVRALGEHDVAHLWLELVPRAWLLRQRRGSEVFLGRTVPEVLCDKLRAIGLVEGRDFVVALQADYPVREIIVQYDETDEVFFQRLCEQAGITTLFSQEDGVDALVLTDAQDRFRPLAGRDGYLHVRGADRPPAAYEVERMLRRVPAQTAVHDYNYRTPRLGLRAGRATATPASVGESVREGEHTKIPSETERIAEVRRAQLELDHHVVRGRSTALSLSAGRRFTLCDAAGHEEELLAIRVAHHAHVAQAGERPEGASRSWDNEFTAIPGAVIYRPPLRTPKPRVSGLLHAVVDGAVGGPYAELDEAGRYHVRLGYDRSGRTSLGASHPVRMMQPHAGAGYGMHFPLRPETEVLVACVHGDPDRPIIVGSAPHPLTASPVVRSNQTQNVLRTGSANELVIEDEIGNERIRLHTPHANTTLQLGSAEEPEEGALLVTKAHITEASQQSNNEATLRKTVLAQSSTTLLGDSAIVLAGLPALREATTRGMHRPGNVAMGDVGRDLADLARPAGESSGAAQQDDGPAAREAQEAPGGGGDWSALAASLSESAESNGIEAIRVLGRASDEALGQSCGRAQGEPLGELLTPAVVLGSPETAALFSRSRMLLYADRTATLSSSATASVVGRELAELKSPTEVEVAADQQIRLTSPGLLDAAAGQARLVAGYYPKYEPPPLEEGTSIGVMGRQDIHLVSAEHCILACAHKNVIATAHEGDMRLHAKEVVRISASSIEAEGQQITWQGGGVNISGGAITIKGGDVTTEADGAVTIRGASVEIEAGSITLKGPVLVDGDLTVTGQINGG